MRKLALLRVLFGVAALLLLLAVGSAAAEDMAPAAEDEVVVEAAPAGTAVRIDFEIAGQTAKRGHYSVQTPGGGEIASWYAMDGWEDSGWLAIEEIGPGSIWVEVMYYTGPGAMPERLMILNHVPGDEYGWVANGEAHALEVAWPDTDLVCWVTDGSERSAYFSRTVEGIVHRTMLEDGKQDIYKPAALFDQPGEAWTLWDFKEKMACPGANRTAASYNDYLGAGTPYWHLGGGG